METKGEARREGTPRRSFREAHETTTAHPNARVLARMKCVTRARGEVYRRGLHAERITHGEGEIIGAGKMQGRAGNDLNCHYLVDQKKRDADR